VLVTLAIIAAAGSRSSILRRLVIDTLADRLDSEVKLDAFSVDLFPTVDVRGEGLVVQLRGHADMPPLLKIRGFVIKGGLFGLLGRPRRFSRITLDGLEINIPPGGPDFAEHYGRANGPASSDERSSSPIQIEQLESTDAVLRLIPRRAGKHPREFLIHRLTMEGIGVTQRMPFRAELTNPIPRGAISTEGRFGPWSRDVPSATPIEGQYVFQNADLSTIKGLGGFLTSTGEFHGPLGRIEVKGETKTPDFRLEVAGNPVPLSTTFRAVVDGTDGDTYLQAVNAQLAKTPIEASGVIAGTPGVKGRTVQVSAKIVDGRIEDLLRLSVKGKEPLLTGNVSLQSDFTLPPGENDVVDRMRLQGNFDLSSAQFTSGAVRAKLGEMSARASGKPDEVPARVISDLEGRFTLAGGVLSLAALKFQIPGAAVQLDGTYGLRSEALDFSGTLRMQATISQAAGGGAMSVFLKIVDPLFKKKGAGTVLPIRVRGTREDPKFGVDVMKALTPK
jgi:AsmA-like protein